MTETALVQTQQPRRLDKIEQVLLYGDLSQLNQEERVQYVSRLCTLTGLNPLTKPFEFITLQGKLVCYSGKNCAEQLRKLHKISIRITARETRDETFIVTCEASMPDGRFDSALGAVDVAGLKGERLANAMMKAETKAKRRATLSLLGLGMPDESEIEGALAELPKIRPDQPGAEDGDPAALIPWRFSVGQWAKRGLEEIERNEGLDKMRAWHDKVIARHEKARAEGKPIPNEQQWLDDLKVLAEYIGDRENDFDHFTGTEKPCQ